MILNLRRSTIADLDLLIEIEKEAFPEWQQTSRRIIRHSIISPSQIVFIAELHETSATEPVGEIILQIYKKTIRVYSLAVLNKFKGKGFGTQLLNYVINFARSHGFERISLEVDAQNEKLLSWYKFFGFIEKERMPDYYADGIDVYRLVLPIPENIPVKGTTYIVVVNEPQDWKLFTGNAKLVSAMDYLSNHDVYNRNNFRVFNLCDSYKYQTLGYYVSLLANAREHKVIPAVSTLRDTKDIRIIESLADDFDTLLQDSLRKMKTNPLNLKIYFGECTVPSLNKLATKVFQMFELPFLNLKVEKREKWEITKIEPLSLGKTPAEDFNFIQKATNDFLSQQRFHRTKMKNYEYDLAVLINQNELNPPSDKKALELFKQAASRQGFYVEFISKADINRLSEFDALFIRETTNVNNYTYQFSRKAYAEGLVVIDDPWSVLKCSNKIYLHERLTNNKVPVPDTTILYKGKIKKEILNRMQFPLILKQPDSAFSMGVIKVENTIELKQQMNRLFQKSDLILAQKYSPTPFDWRIGVLDNQVLFACKYYMSEGHWQIYDWKKEGDPSGDSETFQISEVPKKVIQTALKAASLMGDGLYGVDLKEIDGKIVVIEVNDNPNIDAGIEDLADGIEVYNKVIKSIKTRIEMSRNIARFVSVETS